MIRRRSLNRTAITTGTQARLASVIAEVLEQRQLLSASPATLLATVPNPSASPVDDAVPQGSGFPAGSATPPGYSPIQIADAYGINNISFSGTSGNGAGETIAIVVAYDNPNLVDTGSSGFANSDLHNFDVAFGLPDPPSFTKVDQTGGTNYPTENDGWANEAALDVEWTHAIAPEANIVLVEANSTNLSDLIEGAASYAASIPSVSVVTMSFAVDEFYGETDYDSYLTTPSGHQGVTFLAASGDNGDVGGYPAYSPDVVAVGATTLNLSGDTYVSESGLNTSGGGISQYESKPSYQFGETKSSEYRTIPDVAINGDKNTGLSVYDSLNGGSSTPWYKIGGTSASTPVWAALVAIANQGRAKESLGTLNGLTQTLPELYSLNGSDFHDITTGSNGLSAGTGYDLVTGLGTPIANKLVPDLAGGAKLSGTVFADPSGSGTYQSGDSGLSGYKVFIDLYGSGVEQGVDFETTSDSSGNYSFTGLPGGTYQLTQIAPAGVDLTTPRDQSVTLGYDTTLTGEDIGFKPTGAVSKLGFAQQPTTVVVGDVITPPITVNVEDASGGIVPSDDSAVTLSVASGPGSLGGTLTVNAVNGVATFSDITVSSTGTESLQATDGSLTSTISASFSVTPPPSLIGNPAQVQFAQQPLPAVVGTVLSPAITVQVQDSKGNLVTTDSSTVTLSIASGPAGATLGGTLTVNAVNGIATFSDITVSSVGSYMLTASDAALTPATSSTFAVTPIVYVPTELVFAQQPTSAFVGDPLSSIVVNVETATGVVDPNDDSAVTLSISSGPAGAVLGGVTSAYAVNGVATFSGLTLSELGTYTITANDGSLTPATTLGFAATIPGTVAPTILHSTLPAAAVGGTKLHSTVVVTETNTAANTASGSVTTEIFASEDGSMILLGTVTKRVKVLANKSFSVSVPIKLIPASMSGTYSLESTVLDTLGNPSTSAAAGTLQVAAPFIKLSPTISKLTLAPAVVGGGKSSAVAVINVTNSGNITSTGLTTIGIYASRDGTTADATAIAVVTRKLSIPAGHSLSITVPLKQIPASLSGDYKLLAEVTDPNDTVTSISSTTTYNFAPPFLTFALSGITETPAAALTGKPIIMTLTIENTGNIPATGEAMIVLGVSSNGIAQFSQLTTVTRRVSLAPGKQQTLTLKFPFYVAVAPGNYYPFITYTQDGVTAAAAGTTTFNIG
jgi:hypothetical protein